jgi:hypothetical protein
VTLDNARVNLIEKLIRFPQIRTVRILGGEQFSTQQVVAWQQVRPELRIVVGDYTNLQILGKNPEDPLRKEFQMLNWIFKLRTYPNGLPFTTLESDVTTPYRIDSLSAPKDYRLSPADVDRLARCMRVMVCELAGAQNVDEFLQGLLPAHVYLRQFMLQYSDVTDQGFLSLVKMGSLMSIDVTQTKISEAALRHFHELRPDVELIRRDGKSAP